MNTTYKTAVAQLFRQSLLLSLGLLLSFCSQPKMLKEVFQKKTPHEEYQDKLTKAGLHNSELGKKWISISSSVLEEALPISIPFQETGYFPSEQVTAVAYKFEAREGEQLNIKLKYHKPGSFRLFGDLFYLAPQAAPAHVANLDTAAISLTYEPEETGTYALRLQPELLRGGNYTLSITKTPVLGFPVKGHGNKAIGSFFGDPRDGGARPHHGIDIFAKKRTPVVAVSDGVITRTGTTNLGGKVVWQASKGGRHIYYAHLDSQLVSPGTYVKKGDVVGLMGNTGNAKFTPPHLHFGIYTSGRGPVDPYPYVFMPDTTLPAIKVKEELLSQALRLKPVPVKRGKKKLKDAPENQHQIGRVLGARENSYRVLWPSGKQEYLAASATEPVTKPIGQRTVSATTALLENPNTEAVVVDSLPAKQKVQLIGRYGSYWFVQAGSKSGWLNEQAL